MSECASCRNTQPMYDGAERDGNFWRVCDDCKRVALPNAAWPGVSA